MTDAQRLGAAYAAAEDSEAAYYGPPRTDIRVARLLDALDVAAAEWTGRAGPGHDADVRAAIERWVEGW